MKLDIISLANKKVGDIDLDEAIFGIDVRGDLMARTVNWQLAKRPPGVQVCDPNARRWHRVWSGRPRPQP